MKELPITVAETKKNEIQKRKQESNKIYVGDKVILSDMFFNHHTIDKKNILDPGEGVVIAIHTEWEGKQGLWYGIKFPKECNTLFALYVLGFIPTYHYNDGKPVILIHPVYVEKVRISHGKIKNNKRIPAKVA